VLGGGGKRTNEQTIKSGDKRAGVKTNASTYRKEERLISGAMCGSGVQSITHTCTKGKKKGERAPRWPVAGGGGGMARRKKGKVLSEDGGGV